MQVKIRLTSIQEDPDFDGVYLALFVIETPEEARAMSSRIGLPMILEVPNAKPPDIYQLKIPSQDRKKGK